MRFQPFLCSNLVSLLRQPSAASTSARWCAFIQMTAQALTLRCAALRLTFDNVKPFRHEHRVFQRDGSLRWVSSHAERQGTGHQTRVAGLVQT